jgi:hypothetical protein
MYDEARKAIISSSETSSVYIGCDSVRYRTVKGFMAKYSTVIVLHMDSNRGCKLFHNNVTIPDYGNLKQRLLNEVMYAINAATEIIDCIGDRHMEIHLDINTNEKHKSSVAVKEAIGYVRGSLNIEPKLKPYSFAATHAADHLAKN